MRASATGSRSGPRHRRTLKAACRGHRRGERDVIDRNTGRRRQGSGGRHSAEAPAAIGPGCRHRESRGRREPGRRGREPIGARATTRRRSTAEGRKHPCKPGIASVTTAPTTGNSHGASFAAPPGNEGVGKRLGHRSGAAEGSEVVEGRSIHIELSRRRCAGRLESHPSPRPCARALTAEPMINAIALR